MCDFTRIRCHLSKPTAIALANALISSRLDYCNSLLSSISVKNLYHLEGIQNTICRNIFLDFLIFQRLFVLVKACTGPGETTIYFLKKLLPTYKSNIVIVVFKAVYKVVALFKK